jgi:hypothetical protein
MVAASPAIMDRFGNRLQWAHLTLDELAEVAEEWTKMPDGERASWSLDWDQLMTSDLPEIEQYYRCGKLAAEQRARYRDLRRRLKAALPTIERLNLCPPPVPLVDRPANAPAGNRRTGSS